MWRDKKWLRNEIVAYRGTHLEKPAQSISLAVIDLTWRKQRQHHKHEQHADDDLTSILVRKCFAKLRWIGLSLEQ